MLPKEHNVLFIERERSKPSASPVIIKEAIKPNSQYLHREAQVILRLRGLAGFPQFISYGQDQRRAFKTEWLAESELKGKKIKDKELAELPDGMKIRFLKTYTQRMRDAQSRSLLLHDHRVENILWDETDGVGLPDLNIIKLLPGSDSGVSEYAKAAEEVFHSLDLHVLPFTEKETEQLVENLWDLRKYGFKFKDKYSRDFSRYLVEDLKREKNYDRYLAKAASGLGQILGIPNLTYQAVQALIDSQTLSMEKHLVAQVLLQLLPPAVENYKKGSNAAMREKSINQLLTALWNPPEIPQGGYNAMKHYQGKIVERMDGELTTFADLIEQFLKTRRQVPFDWNIATPKELKTLGEIMTKYKTADLYGKMQIITQLKQPQDIKAATNRWAEGEKQKSVRKQEEARIIDFFNFLGCVVNPLFGCNATMELEGMKDVLGFDIVYLTEYIPEKFAPLRRWLETDAEKVRTGAISSEKLLESFAAVLTQLER